MGGAPNHRAVASPSGDSPVRPDLSALRARVRAIERGGVAPAGPAVPLGLPAVDAVLAAGNDGGLATGRVHEVWGEARSEVRDAACFGFAAALLARLLAAGPPGGRVLWCGRDANAQGGGLRGRGRADLGLDPGRVIRVAAAGEAERLWVMEEALRCRGLVAVLAEAGPLAPTRAEAAAVAARRLQLAAEAGGVTGILLRPDPGPHAPAALPVESRWQVRATPSAVAAVDWRPCWQVTLLRARGVAGPSAWTLSWDAAARVFTPAGPAVPSESRQPESRQPESRQPESRQPRPAAPVPLGPRGRRDAA